MEIRMESPNNALVSSPSTTVQEFLEKTIVRSNQWLQQLQNNPDDFVVLEEQIDIHYRHGAGQLVASLLALATSGAQMDEHVENVRKNATCPLRKGRSNSRVAQVGLGANYANSKWTKRPPNRAHSVVGCRL